MKKSILFTDVTEGKSIPFAVLKSVRTKKKHLELFINDFIFAVGNYFKENDFTFDELDEIFNGKLISGTVGIKIEGMNYEIKIQEIEVYQL